MGVGPTDVVECESHSELAKTVNGVEQRTRMRQSALLVDFQHQPLRRNVRAGAPAREDVTKRIAMSERIGMNVQKQQRPIGELCSSAKARRGARKLEIGDALLPRRILKEDFG